MSRDDYNPVNSSGVRSPGRVRRLQELPTVDRSPSRDYGARGSPLGEHTCQLTKLTTNCLQFTI